MKYSFEYVGPRRLGELKPEAVVTFSFKDKLRTLRLPGNRFAKLEFCTAEELEGLRDAGEKLGMKRDQVNPSSWSSLFHEAFGAPRRMRYGTSLLLPENIIGAWQEIGKDRTADGVVEYDMVSAYAWAGLRPLPCHWSAWPTRKWAGRGLYLCRVLHAGRRPYPLLRSKVGTRGTIWLTSEEIEEMDLRVEIVRGVIFSRWWEPRRRIEAIMEAAPERLWKKILRSYWGSWASDQPTTCHAIRTDKRWNIDNIFFDPAAAHYVVSRVRNRISQVADLALHVFTDAIMTRGRLVTGSNLGDWRIKQKYRKVVIQHPGRWKGITAEGKVEEKRSGATEPIEI